MKIIRRIAYIPSALFFFFIMASCSVFSKENEISDISSDTSSSSSVTESVSTTEEASSSSSIEADDDRIENFSLHFVNHEEYFDYLENSDEEYYTAPDEIELGNEYVIILNFVYNGENIDDDTVSFSVSTNKGLFLKDFLSSSTSNVSIDNDGDSAVISYTNIDKGKKTVSCEILCIAVSAYELFVMWNDRYGSAIYILGNPVKPNSVFEYEYLDDAKFAIKKYKGNEENLILGNNSSVVSIKNYAFSSNADLKSITIGGNITEIGSCAFWRCSSLTDVIISDSVTSIGEEAFKECSSLESITLPFIGASASENQYLSYLFGAEKYNDYSILAPSSLKEVRISDKCTDIADNAFFHCTDLTKVIIGNGVTDIGNNAFYNCSSLANLIIGNNVRTIGASAFFACSSLTKVTIPDSVTKIGREAFDGCTGLTSITLPGNISDIGYALFYKCSSLESVTISNGITNIGDSMFDYCSNLKKVIIPDSVTEIGSYAFAFCTSLTNITVPESVKEIKSHAFDGCSSLANFVIPDGNTVINEYAFYQCSSLASITIPKSITGIGRYSFFDCVSLTDITYSGTKEQWNSIVKESFWKENAGSFVVHCTDGDIE